MTIRVRSFIISGFILVASAAWAHHNYTSAYDMAKTVPLTGTLHTIDWRNPHIAFLVEVKDEKGAVLSWELEGAAPMYFDKPNVQKFVGQTVTTNMSPARNGSLRGLMRSMTFLDGTTLKGQ